VQNPQGGGGDLLFRCLLRQYSGATGMVTVASCLASPNGTASKQYFSRPNPAADSLFGHAEGIARTGSGDTVTAMDQARLTSFSHGSG